MNEKKDKIFIPYVILEEYYRKKYLSDIKSRDLFTNYVSSFFGVKKDKIIFDVSANIFDNRIIDSIYIKIPRNPEPDYYKIEFYSNRLIKTTINFCEWGSWRKLEENDSKSRSFEKNKKTKEYLDCFIIPYLNKQRFSHIAGYHLPTNDSNFLVDIDICRLNSLEFSIYNPYSRHSLYNKYIDANQETQKLCKKRSPIYSDPFPDEIKRELAEEETAKIKFADEKKYTEEEIGKILINLKVDISSFSKEEQEEINQFYIANISKLDDDKAEKLKEFRQIQIDRIMLAYQKFKEVIELLNETKMDLKFERIRVENLESIIFKNNGNPTEKGYIEFEDFFKNNMILRMLDLSQLDLTNVNITNMDFSGTNVHINPQTIYNKDMTGVNATDVHFSPFNDSFRDVILDGAIITDYEAMINFDELKSYSNATVVKNEVVAKFSTR